MKAQDTGSHRYRTFSLVLSALSLFSLITIAIYLAASPDGVLFNCFANVWLLTLWLGIIAIMLSPGPVWAGLMYAGLIGLYFTVHSLFTYAGSIVPCYDSKLYMLSSGGTLLLAMVGGILFGLVQLKTWKQPRTGSPRINWVFVALLMISGAVYTYIGVDPVGFTFIESMEYLEFMYLFCGLALIHCAFGVRLMRSCGKVWVKQVVTAAFAILAGINLTAFVYQIDVSFAASRANEAEISGLHYSEVRLGVSDGDLGRWGLYEDTTVESEFYPAPLSLAMMLCGNEQPTDKIEITYTAGNWHENTGDGVILYYDVYAPAEAACKTPVVINIHGYNAFRAWVDTYPQLCSLGYTVLDVEYGMDSETKNGGTVNSPDGTECSAENIEFWIQDMEHLFRYLKEHDDELNIDLTNVFLYGHSAGCYMSTGMDNMLLGKGFENYAGEMEYTSYNRYAEYYTEGAASENVSDFVDVRGLILLYGVSGRFFADGLDPILFSTGTTDSLVQFELAKQIYKLRATNNIEHFYILDAGLGSHSFDNRSSYELYNQLTNRYIEMFVKRFGQFE